METNNSNETLADAAKEWQSSQKSAKEFRLEEKQRQKEEKKEQEEHWKVMKAFSGSFYETKYQETIEEPYFPYNDVRIYECKIHYPSDDAIELLMKRGNHEEVMQMIKAYQAKPPQSSTFESYTGYTDSLEMPLILQNFIAARGNFEEMMLFCQRQGFGAEGQNILLNRANHTELMWYLEKHGFLLEQQKKLIARGNHDEIRQHIIHHALADELLNEMMDELSFGNTESFYRFIAIRELPVKQQVTFLKVAKEKEFMNYIERYGFWGKVLPDLVRLRSDAELTAYIKKHHYLGYGVEELALRGNTELSQLYIEDCCDTSLWRLISAFSSVPKLDYKILVKLYSKVERPDYHTFSESKIKELELMQDGMKSEVLSFLKEKRTELNLFIEATLFFRNFPDEYELYLKNIGRRKENPVA